MSYRKEIFSAANLMAYLEATSSGWIEASQEEQLQALEAVRQVSKAEDIKRRAHRRPSPGRSRFLRDKGSHGFVLLLVAGLSTLLVGISGCA